MSKVSGLLSYAFADMRANPERILDYQGVFRKVGLAYGGTNATEQGFNALIYLMDASGNSNNGSFVRDSTRAEIIARGLSWFSSAGGQYVSALAALDAMIASYPECSGGCNAKTVRNYIQTVLNAHSTFNPNHDWTEPRLDANLAFSAAAGSTDLRDLTAIAGPHGDYRLLLQGMSGLQLYSALTLEDLVAAGAIASSADARNAAIGGDAAFYFNVAFHRAYLVAGLAIDYEDPAVATDIETAFAQGSTGRGREFFQGAMMSQLLLNVSNRTSRPNGFGLLEFRGVAGAFGSVRYVFRDTLLAANGDQGVVTRVALAQEHLLDAWTRLDRAAWDGAIKFTLKNPPFIGGGDPAPCPDCPPPALCPDCPPPVVCPPTPTFDPVLSVDSLGGVSVACVEVP
jgi:hypothetical protein